MINRLLKILLGAYSIMFFVILLSSLLVVDIASAEICGNGGGCNTVGAQITNSINHDQTSIMYFNGGSGSSARSSSSTIYGSQVQAHSPHRVYLPTYFTDHLHHTENYIAIMNMILYKDVFTRSELEVMAKDGDVDIVVNKVLEHNVKSEVLTVLYPVKGIKNPQGVYIANLTGKVDDSNDGTNSIHAFAKACLAALDNGANVVYIQNEGANRILRSFGGGVGFSYTRGSVGGGGSNSNVASGGTGFSWGHARYEEEPFIHLVALIMTPDAVLERKSAIANLEAEKLNQNAASSHPTNGKKQILQNRRQNLEGNLP